MGQTTGIEWTEKTWNHWHGCHKVSPGCKFCYMFRDKKRYGQDPNVVVRSRTTFNAPLEWPRDPAMCFTCSWSDWLIEEADPWREEAYEVIRRTPHITYQILTKRIERAEWRVPNVPLPHIWFGVSIEDRKYGLPRIDGLRNIPASVRFLSIEPLLEDLGQIDLTGIDWVILGGESGPEARPMAPAWARDIRDQCISANVPLFFKQWGEYAPTGNNRTPLVNVPGGDGTHHRMLRVGKKAAGRLLDGREWSEFPQERK